MAQNSDDKEAYNESVVVEGSFRPVISQHQKLDFPTSITDTIAPISHTFRYSIEPTRLKALYEPSRIKAARIIGEPATKLYNNYLRLGVGNYWSPLASVYWSSTRDKRKTYGVRLNHRSSWGSISNYGSNHFSLTDATLFGKLIVKERLQLSADIGYENDHNLYYGFHDTTLASYGLDRDNISLRDIRANYNVATVNVGLKNLQLDANKLGYEVNVRASDLWAAWSQNEFNLNLSGDVHYGFNIRDTYKGVAYMHVEWDGYTHRHVSSDQPFGYLPAPADDTLRGWRNIVKLNPYADFMLRGLQFHAGFTAGWDGFTHNGDSVVFRFFPDVVVSKSLLNETLVLSLAATGGFDANNWNVIRLANPYVAPNAEQRATRHYDFVGHLRWNPAKKLELNAEVSYSLLRDDLSFCTDTLYRLRNTYRPYYFSHNRLSVGGDVAFVNDEMLTLRLGGHYYHYNLVGSDTLLLYRPDFDVFVGADVNYHDKWYVHLTCQLLGAMHDEAGEKLPMRYGVGLGVEYRHNRALSFFLQADNLAFQRYYLWSRYPSQRAQFFIGLTYTIPHK